MTMSDIATKIDFTKGEETRLPVAVCLAVWALSASFLWLVLLAPFFL